MGTLNRIAGSVSVVALAGCLVVLQRLLQRTFSHAANASTNSTVVEGLEYANDYKWWEVQRIQATLVGQHRTDVAGYGGFPLR